MNHCLYFNVIIYFFKNKIINRNKPREQQHAVAVIKPGTTIISSQNRRIIWKERHLPYYKSEVLNAVCRSFQVIQIDYYCLQTVPVNARSPSYSWANWNNTVSYSREHATTTVNGEVTGHQTWKLAITRPM